PDERALIDLDDAIPEVVSVGRDLPIRVDDRGPVADRVVLVLRGERGAAGRRRRTRDRRDAVLVIVGVAPGVRDGVSTADVAVRIHHREPATDGVVGEGRLVTKRVGRVLEQPGLWAR